MVIASKSDLAVVIVSSVKVPNYSSTVLRKNPASAKIVKIEYNANLDLLHFFPFHCI